MSRRGPAATPLCRIKTDVERHYLAALDAAPQFKAEVLSARREERIYGTGHVPGYYRKPYGPDGPWSAIPATIAIRAGAGHQRRASASNLLAGALSHVFPGASPWDTALASYETARTPQSAGFTN